MIKFCVALSLLSLLAAGVSSAMGESLSVKGKAFSIRVSSDGLYEISTARPDWRFSGDVHHPVTDLHDQRSKDGIGEFEAINFKWEAEGSKSAEIRAYTDKPLVRFILTCDSAQPKPPMPFPTLQPPKGLHLFSYAENNFAPPCFNGQENGTPWLMFDDAGQSAILSPASHFMIASLRSGQTAPTRLVSDGESPTSRPSDMQTTSAPIECGWVRPLENLPAGFSQSTVLCVGDTIGQTFSAWGQALTDLSGKKRPANDADAGLKYFGYWTDNGATYYYHYDPELGYANTLLAVKKAFADLSVPLGYLQLDSWWYVKTSLNYDGKLGSPYKTPTLPHESWNRYGGLTEYVAHPNLFPKGLAAFHDQAKLPFITHNRWLDLNSPYRDKYKTTGVAVIDPTWWDQIAAYLKSTGVMTYEQDWLDRIYKFSPEFQSTPTAADAFMDNMARACAEKGLTMQYCMGLPRHFLQASKYDNLTSIRVSGDRFDRHFWEQALYVSAMAGSLGEWPWVDTFNSPETPNLILATLTAGMVGVGDKIGSIDRANIFEVIRADGVNVKPDTAIVPLDRTFLADATRQDQPFVAAAYSNQNDHRTAYVFTFPRNDRQMKGVFRPVDLGFAGDVWVYDTQAKTGSRVALHEPFAVTFTDPNPKTAWAYYIVAPVTPSGIALIGDAGKFASAGRQRLPEIGDVSNGLRVKVAFAIGDSAVDLIGFAPTAPAATVDGRSATNVDFDAKTSQFRLRIEPSDSQKPDVEVDFSMK